MSNEVKLSTFPSSVIEALALLYLQNQDLKGKTPEDIQTLYYEAHQKLRDDYTEKSKSGWFRDLQLHKLT